MSRPIVKKQIDMNIEELKEYTKKYEIRVDGCNPIPRVPCQLLIGDGDPPLVIYGKTGAGKSTGARGMVLLNSRDLTGLLYFTKTADSGKNVELSKTIPPCCVCDNVSGDGIRVLEKFHSTCKANFATVKSLEDREVYEKFIHNCVESPESLINQTARTYSFRALSSCVPAIREARQRIDNDLTNRGITLKPNESLFIDIDILSRVIRSYLVDTKFNGISLSDTPELQNFFTDGEFAYIMAMNSGPRKFLVVFDDISEDIEASLKLRSRGKNADSEISPSEMFKTMLTQSRAEYNSVIFVHTVDTLPSQERPQSFIVLDSPSALAVSRSSIPPNQAAICKKFELISTPNDPDPHKKYQWLVLNAKAPARISQYLTECGYPPEYHDCYTICFDEMTVEDFRGNVEGKYPHFKNPSFRSIILAHEAKQEKFIKENEEKEKKEKLAATIAVANASKPTTIRPTFGSASAIFDSSLLKVK